MNEKLNFILSFLLILNFIQCKKETAQHALPQETKKTQYISHASSFNLIIKADDIIYQQIRGTDTISQFIDKQNLPYKNLAIFSSSAIGYISALESINHVKSVYNADWIYNPKVHQLIAQKKIIDGGNAASANLETILAQQPDAIIAYSDPNQSKLLESVKNLGIPIIYIDEYLEKSPLGKAEYLKIFGVLLDQKHQADSLFTVIQNNYENLQKIAAVHTPKPSVFAEVMRGDIWYMPGGNSFQARYFEDAGGKYLWNDNESSGTINLNFEQVYSQASKADFWMNVADFSSLHQLQNAYKNHDWFGAYKNQRVYSFSQRMNAKGANDYFETGTVRADWVLRDLTHIFHPEILPNHKLIFYRKLK